MWFNFTVVGAEFDTMYHESCAALMAIKLFSPSMQSADQDSDASVYVAIDNHSVIYGMPKISVKSLPTCALLTLITKALIKIKHVAVSPFYQLTKKNIADIPTRADRLEKFPNPFNTKARTNVDHVARICSQVTTAARKEFDSLAAGLSWWFAQKKQN